MRAEEVMSLVTAGEGQEVEFKETTGQSQAAIRTLAAFASQRSGGTVIFGVNDDGTINRSFSIAANAQERLSGLIRSKTLSMVTAQPVVPELYVFRDPDLLVAHISPGYADEHGQFLADGYRWRRAGSTTVKVLMDYKQLARAYRQHLYDEDAARQGHPFPIRFCEECGSQELDFTSMEDSARDELYFVVRCRECGWGDWTQ